MAVSKFKILANVELQDLFGFDRFLGPPFDCSAGSHLAFRYIQGSGAIAQMFHFQKRSSHRQFNIVRVGKHGQNIDLAHKPKFNTDFVFRDKGGQRDNKYHLSSSSLSLSSCKFTSAIIFR